ncbi:MAG: cupin domain-containing protein [Phycisphaerae bacterium]|nr:cupin domain-containing protein [Gemmatimonadaceae bacterium]
MQYAYPHTLDNGAGERLVFQRRVATRNGERVEGENFVTAGNGPPMHVHYLQDEVFTVKSGRAGFQRLGQESEYAGPGETIVFKAGEAHRFWNAGTEVLNCAAYIEPADNIEYFLEQIFASAKSSGNGRPNILDAAYLTHRYRSEYAMLVVPSAVQRFLFPVLIAIGSLMGRYTKYEDAPEPITRALPG